KRIRRDERQRGRLDETPVLPQSQERLVQTVMFVRQAAGSAQLGRDLRDELGEHRIVEEDRLFRAGGAVERLVEGAATVPPVLEEPGELVAAPVHVELVLDRGDGELDLGGMSGQEPRQLMFRWDVLELERTARL